MTDVETKNATAAPSTYDVMIPFQQKIRDSVIHIAPENNGALPAWIKKPDASWLQIILGKEAQITAYPTIETIKVTSAALASIWAVTNAALRLWGVYDKAHADNNIDTEGPKNVDLSRELHEVGFDRILNFARELTNKDRLWSDDVPIPDVNAQFSSREGRAVNLFLAAISWMLLHEIGHIDLAHTDLLDPVFRYDEERQADDYATGHVFNAATIPVTHRIFRFMAVAVAIVYLGIKDTIHKPLRPGSQTHPPVYERLWAMQVGSDALDCADTEAHTYAGILLKAVFDPGAEPHATEPKELMNEMFESLVSAFRSTHLNDTHS